MSDGMARRMFAAVIVMGLLDLAWAVVEGTKADVIHIGLALALVWFCGRSLMQSWETA